MIKNTVQKTNNSLNIARIASILVLIAAPFLNSNANFVKGDPDNIINAPQESLDYAKTKILDRVEEVTKKLPIITEDSANEVSELDKNDAVLDQGTENIPGLWEYIKKGIMTQVSMIWNLPSALNGVYDYVVTLSEKLPEDETYLPILSAFGLTALMPLMAYIIFHDFGCSVSKHSSSMFNSDFGKNNYRRSSDALNEMLINFVS